ncbi:MAG: type II toxin-antitoxin system VapC family toxin [Micromonosporaceae bacterium]
MILLDVNVLVAAYRADQPHYKIARPWFDELTNSDEPFGVPDEVWASFVRITTNRRIFSVPTPITEAFEFVTAVRGQPNHIAVSPGTRRLQLFERLCDEGEASGDLVPDAYLAALAVEQGATLVSFDRDFARFPGLKWRTPSGS